MNSSLMQDKRDRQRGFTLVELITVMVILGILAAVAAPRFFDSGVFQERGAADQVKAALRYGQKVAIAQHKVVSVTISTASSSNCGTNLNVGGNVDCAVQVAFTGGPTVYFNALGQPVTDATGTALVAVNGSITVGTTPAITIERETGYVH